MNKGTGWRVLLALIGLIAVLIGYFWAHKPLDPALLFTLGGAVLDVLTAALIVSVAGGLGRRILRLEGTRHVVSLPNTDPQNITQQISRAERLALEALLGLGVLGWLALLLGLIGLYKGLIFWILLIVVGAVCFRAVLGWGRDFGAILRRVLKPETGWIRFLTVVTAVLLFTALLFALAPPTAFDAMNYHLVGPKVYLAAGQIMTQADNHFLGFPQGAEILYGMAMSLFGRETAAAPLHFAFGILGLLAVAGLVRRYADKAAAWLAVALLVSAFSMWLLFGWPYIDLAVLAYSAAALIAATQWREHQSDSPMLWLILIGLYVGLAVGVKYTAGALALAMVFYLLWNAPRQAVRNIVIMGGVALIAFIPWALKGLLLYHNPVYPYFFNGVNWDAGRSFTFSTAGQGLLSTGNAWQLIVMPFAATIFGVEKTEGFSFTVGPWLLTAPFLLLIGWRWLDTRGRTLAKDCVVLALPLLAFWIVMAALTGIGVQTRLMMMAMPVVAVLAALGFYSLSKMPRKPLDLGFVARALIALTMVFALLDAARTLVEAEVVPALMASVSADDYRTENLGVYNVAMDRLAQLPAGSQVRFLFEPRTYLCPTNVTCLGDILFDFWARPLQQGAMPDAVFQSWKDAGDDYLLLFNAGYDFNAKDPRFADQNVQFPDALQHWMTPLWSDPANGYTLYGWKAG